MDKHIPKAGTKPGGEECRCVCHRMPGVNHMMPCCFKPFPKEILEEIKKKKKEEK